MPREVQRHPGVLRSADGHRSPRWRSSAGSIETIERWRWWTARGEYDGPYADAVARSALVLTALTHGPSGAMVAAPTTSPSRGRRRRGRSQLRLPLLVVAQYQSGRRRPSPAGLPRRRARVAVLADGCGGPALILACGRSTRSTRRRGAARSRLTSTAIRGTRPVRVGNGAAGQLQLGTYGDLLATAWLSVEQDGHYLDGAAATPAGRGNEFVSADLSAA